MVKLIISFLAVEFFEKDVYSTLRQLAQANG